MSDVVITRKTGSTEPETFTVQSAGAPLDLTAKPLQAGQWSIWTSAGTRVVDPEANGTLADGPGFSVVDAAAGKVKLDPQGAAVGGGNAFGDVGHEADSLIGVLVLRFSDGHVASWPDDGYVIIRLESSGP